MTKTCDLNSIAINGVDYVRADSIIAPAVAGTRAIVVVDRGWVFAGNVTKDEIGQITLSKALHVFKWSSTGFAGLVNDPKAAKADLRPLADVVIPANSVIFSVPIPDNWGK